jgi:hypothetical protein
MQRAHQVRASRVNGRAFRIDLHPTNARVKEETEQGLDLLDACREALFDSVRAANSDMDRGGLVRPPQREPLRTG